MPSANFKSSEDIMVLRVDSTGSVYLGAVPFRNRWCCWGGPLAWPLRMISWDEERTVEYWVWPKFRGKMRPSRGFLQMKPCSVLHISSFHDLINIQQWKILRRKTIGDHNMLNHLVKEISTFAQKNGKILFAFKLEAISSQIGTPLIWGRSDAWIVAPWNF